MREEIHQLELLEHLKRILPEEQARLNEYRRLLGKIMVLPGFEFTATFGFHVLGIFHPDKPVREIEHLLLDLSIPPEHLDEGSATVGATTDVLTAYQVINEAGGLVIAAHANSSNGVAMRGFPIGGQTKIAYTQDPNLHALEVTDLEHKGQRSTAAFFNGSKPEYPRRMHCMQGSDAHRLERDPKDKHALGVGDRVTEILLPEVSFEALKEVLLGNDFTRTRPHQAAAETPLDFVRAAQEAGPSIVQSFHESVTRKGSPLQAILRDVAAFANTNGGTIYVGAGAKPKARVTGVERPEEASRMLVEEISRALTPPLKVDIDVVKSEGKNVLRVTVPKGENPPYALTGTEVYIRQEAETSRALRDEIVQLVRRALGVLAPSPKAATPPPAPVAEGLVAAPRTGVEVVEVTEREGTKYYSLRDLRNGNVVQNVTRTSARRLWRYALTENETRPVQVEQVKWSGNLGLWKVQRRSGRKFYDFVQRGSDGRLHIYYGVTDDGVHGEWRQFVEERG